MDEHFVLMKQGSVDLIADLDNKTEIKSWYVYLLECSDGTYYCGLTNNLKARIKAHNEGKGAKYTSGRKPVRLLHSVSNMSKKEAFQLEYQIKKLPRSQKIEFIKSVDSKI